MYFQCYWMQETVPSNHPMLPDRQIVLTFTRTAALDTLYWFMTGSNPNKVWNNYV